MKKNEKNGLERYRKESRKDLCTGIYSVVWYQQADRDHRSGDRQSGTLPYADFLRGGGGIRNLEHGNELSQRKGGMVI